jgi:ubiquinone/menaquinone biosynthesis C-methylase UbiE
MIDYAPEDGRFLLTDAAAAVLAAEESPASLIAGFAMLPLLHRTLPALAGAFRTGEGVGWLEWDTELHDAEERFSRPFHRNFLVDVWLAGVPGLLDRLTAGATVADVGCGYGTSTIVLAERFPASTFVGYDFHDHSIARAREAGRRAGVTDRVRFEVADAAELPGTGHDLVVFCDSLHDMGDPVAVARRARSTLAAGGRLVTLDPAVQGDSLAEHRADPFAALLYPVSTFICTPAALAQHGPRAMGALAGEAALRQVLTDAGFERVDRVPDTPVNMVLYTSDGGAA